MNDSLPIVVIVNNTLKQQHKKLVSICNKLEAQLNFQTLTANWYSNEEKVLAINLYLETPEKFAIEQKNYANNHAVISHADDVFSLFDPQQLIIDCFIAFTESEQVLVTEKNKLLTLFIEKKLTKVINLIATQQDLPLI
jgi:hypothetical protein